MRCEQDMNNNYVVQQSLQTAVLQKTIPQEDQSVQCLCSMVWPIPNGHNILYNSVGLSINCTLIISRCPLSKVFD